MAERAISAGYAVVAASNLEGTRGCWQSNDVAPVRSALDSWRQEHMLANVKLFVMGPSSGGFFATQAARNWHDVAALSVQVSVPLLTDVAAPLPSGAASFPPLELILMRRDASKLKAADELSKASWPGRERMQPPVVVAPQAVGPNFFAERIKGLNSSASAAIHSALVKVECIDSTTGVMRKHPYRNQLNEPVEQAVKQQSRSVLPQGSQTVTMDGVFALLSMAWGFHASTCSEMDGTLAFFGRYLNMGAASSHTKRMHAKKTTSP